VALARQTGYARAAGPALYLLGRVARASGQHDRAASLFRESLAVRREQGDRRGIAECFEGLASAAAAMKKPEDATRLLGAAGTLRDAIGAPLPPHAGPARAQMENWLRRRLGASYETMHGEGAALPLDAALRLAIGGATEKPTPRPRRAADSRTARTTDHPEHDPSPLLLSPREHEVAALVARGMSNREIASVLVVVEGSAANYVKRILAKLGFRSRVEIAAWVARHRPIR
jgi:DNA-binding CsgD family transcriptional regulator